MYQFHICTIANDLAQYAQMKQSFVEAGFDENSCRYTLLDNSQANAYEPYSAYNGILANSMEPYVIFCHQDLLLNKGHGLPHLQAVLNNLSGHDPLWAIAGNAGVDEYLKLTLHLSDPGGDYMTEALPHQVYALDENFLVVRTDAGVQFSPALSGFHLYGTDLCLNALQVGRTCYVVNFLMTHLSKGNPQSVMFHQAVRDFQRVWNPRFRLYYVRTLSACFFLSRFQFLRKFFGLKLLVKSMEKRGRLHTIPLLLQKKAGDLKTLWGSQSDA